MLWAAPATRWNSLLKLVASRSQSRRHALAGCPSLKASCSGAGRGEALYLGDHRVEHSRGRRGAGRSPFGGGWILLLIVPAVFLERWIYST